MSWTKLAKEALDKCDFADALEMCGRGLEDDGRSFNLLVLKGAALKGLKDASKAEISFREAITVQPEHPLAWQGLLQTVDELRLSSKNAEDKHKDMKVECLKKLLIICPESKKMEYEQKLFDFYMQENKLLEAANLVRLKDEKRYITLIRRWEDAEIKREVEKAKFRLGADPLPILTEKTQASIYKDSPLTELLAGSELIERLFLALKYHRSHDLASKLVRLTATDNSLTSRLIKAELMDSKSPEIMADYPSHLLPVLLSKSIAQRNLELIKQTRSRMKSIQEIFFVEFKEIPETLNRLEGLILAEEGNYEKAIEIFEALEAQDSEVISALVDCYENCGLVEKAIQLQKTLGESPANTIRLCRLLMKTGGHFEIISILTDWPHSVLESDQLLLLGAANWESGNRCEDTLQLFLQSAKSNPSNHQSFTWLGKYYSSIQDSARAEKCFKKALSLSPSDHVAATSLSEIYLARESYMDVIQLLEPLLADYPQKYEAWRCLGVAYFNLQAYSKSASAFHTSLRGCRDKKRVLLLLGHSYHLEGRLAASARAFKAVLDVDSDNRTAKIALAKVSCLLHGYDESLSLLYSIQGHVASVEKEILFVLLKAARFSYNEMFDLKKAQEYVGKALETHCDDALLKAQLNHVATKLQVLPRASQLEAYQAAIDSSFGPAAKSKILATMAGLMIDEGKSKEALEFSHSAVRLSCDPYADNIHAVSLSLSGQYPAAERHLARALSNTKNNRELSWLWSNLGWIYLRAARADLAVQAFEASRIADVDNCGESLFGLSQGSADIDIVLAANSSRSTYLHAQCILNKLRSSVLLTDDLCLQLRPILERFCGRTKSDTALSILQLVISHLESADEHEITDIQDYSDKAIRSAVRRAAATNRSQLPEYISHNPFDLLAYVALISGDSDIEALVELVRSRLRLLEERYDPKEGTMRRDFASVRLYVAIKEWYERSRNNK